MFEEQLSSDRHFLDLWLENNFPERQQENPSVWSYPESSRGADYIQADQSHMFLTGAGPSTQDSWQNTTKSFQVLTFLCSELQLLEQFAKKKFYPALYVIGGSLIRGHSPPMGDLELQLANLLPTLQDALDYLEQLEALLNNLLSQTCAILLDDSLDIKRRVVTTALKCASRGLLVLFCLQTLLSIKILPMFFNYRRMLHTMMTKTKSNISLLEEVQDQVVRLEESLRMGAFTNFVDSHIKHGPIGKHFQKKQVASVIEIYLLENIESCCTQLDLPSENVFARDDLLAALLLFVAYSWAGSYPKDKKVMKAVMEIHSKSPILPMYHSLVVVPARFLIDMLPSAYFSYMPWDYMKQASNHSKAYLANLQKSMVGRLDRISFRGAVWATELSALLSEGDGIISAADREQFMSLLMEGLHMMTHLRRTLDNTIQLHVEQLQPMSKLTLNCITSCICYLKLFSGKIARLWELIEENLDFFLEHYKMLLLDQFKRAYESLLQLERNEGTLRVRKVLFRLGGNQQHSPEYLMVCIKLVKMGIQSLQAKESAPQRLLLSFIVMAIHEFQFVPDFVATDSVACLREMEVVENIGTMLQQMGRCDILYFHPELMRNAFQQLLMHPEQANKLPHLVNGFLDIRFLAEEAGEGQLNSMFEHDIASMLKVYFLDPLGRNVENDLFGIVCGDESLRGIAEDDVKCQNVLPLLQLDPLSLITKDLSILDSIRVQLSKTLRKMSVRGEMTWDVLCKVKNIAQEKYGMVLDNPEASEGSTPSPLDTLNTPDGIKAFVASYMFQMHSFAFVLSPRTPLNPYHDLPEVVTIEDFMYLIQADITQTGQAALSSLCPTADRPSAKRSHTSVEDAADNDILSQGSEDRQGDQVDLITSHESFKKSSSMPGMSASVFGADRENWEFMKKRDMYGQGSCGSGTSVVPGPRSADDNYKEGRITNLIQLLTSALKEKLKQVSELCAASETRSVLSQTTQRWHNSQKAVGNQYPVPQAELVRKEVIALLKAGTLTTNIIHKLRFLIGDIGKVVSLIMVVYHAASSVREKTLSLIPRDVLSSHVSLGSFISSVSDHAKLVQEAVPFDATFGGFESKPCVHVQYMQLLEPIFEEALDENKLEVLRNLFILAPAMSLDHIESMRSLKNQYQGSSLNKEIANTEDSFAVGLSFLLSMLNQMSKFEAFNWFESASRHYHMRLDRVRATSMSQRTSSVTSTLRRTQEMETQRTVDSMDSMILKGTISEFRLLEHSMMCGKVFFERRESRQPSD